MFKEVDFNTASLEYENGKWVRIGESPEHCWSVNREFNDGKTLEEVVERYKQYYDPPVKYFI
jgi:hypothetical protein